MAFEWVAGLFQTEQTRGLSGDTAHTVALDDANPYYNYRLRRHKADGDIVGDHSLLWFTSPYVKRRSGLGTHVAAEVGEESDTTVLRALRRPESAAHVAIVTAGIDEDGVVAGVRVVPRCAQRNAAVRRLLHERCVLGKG